MTIPVLSRREKLFVLAGGLSILATLLWLGVIAPYRDAVSRLDARIAAAQRDRREMELLRQTIAELRRNIQNAEKKISRSGDFSLFAFFEKQVLDIARKENLVHMLPQTPSVRDGFEETSLEVKLEKITLDQMVRLLFAVENADALLQVRNLRIKKRPDKSTLLDVTLNVASVKAKS